jgi:hypothetical protein
MGRCYVKPQWVKIAKGVNSESLLVSIRCSDLVPNICALQSHINNQYNVFTSTRTASIELWLF